MAFVALLAAAWLLLPGELGEESRAGAPRAPRVELDAGTPSVDAAFVAPDTPARADALPNSMRVASAEAQPRGLLRGRLVEAGSGAPFHEERIVLLASPRNAVAETLRTRPDGSF